MRKRLNLEEVTFRVAESTINKESMIFRLLLNGYYSTLMIYKKSLPTLISVV